MTCFTFPVPPPCAELFPQNWFLLNFFSVYPPLCTIFPVFSKHLLVSFLVILQTWHSPLPHLVTFFWSLSSAEQLKYHAIKTYLHYFCQKDTQTAWLVTEKGSDWQGYTPATLWSKLQCGFLPISDHTGTTSHYYLFGCVLHSSAAACFHSCHPIRFLPN